MDSKATYYITRLEQSNRVTIMSGRVSPKQITIDKNNLRRSWHNDLTAHCYVDLEKKGQYYTVDQVENATKEELKKMKLKRIIRFDFNSPEPLRYDFAQQKWIEPKWSQEVEDMMIHTITQERIEVL